MADELTFPETESTTVRVAAMNILARREHSVTELSRKLLAKGYSGESVELIVTDLCNENLLSDERFAESYIRFRRNKGFGPVRIQQELIERGVEANIIDAHLLKEENDWYGRAGEVRKKRFGNALPKDFKNKAKQMRFLQYRGFSNDHLAKLFNEEF